MSSARCTTDHISYDKNRKCYYAYHSGKVFRYSENRYGQEIAMKLAIMSKNSGIKYYDYFENNEDGSTTFFINTKKYGMKKVIVDTEDAPLFFGRKISISKDRYTYYGKTKDGSVHRIIMHPQSSKLVVDHIDHDGLNNRKSNLRIVSVSLNNRNAKVRKDNISGYRGISEDNDSVVFTYYTLKDKEKKKIRRSKKKYKDGKAMQMILDYREKIYRDNGYLL